MDALSIQFADPNDARKSLMILYDDNLPGLRAGEIIEYDGEEGYKKMARRLSHRLVQSHEMHNLWADTMSNVFGKLSAGQRLHPLNEMIVRKSVNEPRQYLRGDDLQLAELNAACRALGIELNA